MKTVENQAPHAGARPRQSRVQLVMLVVAALVELGVIVPVVLTMWNRLDARD